MENIVEKIEEWAKSGETPQEEIVVNGTTLLKSSLETDKVIATLKRDLKTRKVKVLAYEEWSDGVWVKHTSEFINVDGKRPYKPRIRYSRPEDVVELTDNI